MPKQQREFATVAELARTMRISTGKAYKMLRSAEIPCYRFGATYRIRIDDLERYIQASRHEIVEP